MNAADKVRVVLALCFPLGALGHFWWLWKHGDLMYRGPAPEWAVWFWYILCAVDFAVCAVMLYRPKPGIAAGMATMAVSLAVNWLCFPTFEFQFNWVLLGLTAFGIVMWLSGPWLWRHSHWKPGKANAT